MRIYSWNILFENKRLDEAFAFLRALDFDILCLQEVPGEFMAQLRSLPYELASAVEYTYARKDGAPHQTLSVILSRYPIESHEEIEVPNWFLRPILRERIATNLLRFLRIWRWTRSTGNRRHLLAWIDIPDIGPTQVYSLHLTIHSPAARRIELDSVRAKYDQTRPAIMAGDFNIFDTYRVALPAWFFGATVLDTLMPWRERIWAERFFAHIGLQNPLRGLCTHQTTRCQLDHILVSESLEIAAASVVYERYGSDHNPVFVELAARVSRIPRA
ncbi:MAG: endonuclease/exonuclease/phosphatase family protein [Patescibacteria group bacterium]